MDMTQEEYEAIEKKAMNPNEKIICPRCGKELTYKEYGNSYTVKCETEGCISETSRGI